jgi:hypothetical protein
MRIHWSQIKGIKKEIAPEYQMSIEAGLLLAQAMEKYGIELLRKVLAKMESDNKLRQLHNLKQAKRISAEMMKEILEGGN